MYISQFTCYKAFLANFETNFQLYCRFNSAMFDQLSALDTTRTT